MHFPDAVCAVLPTARSRQNHQCDSPYSAPLSQPRRSPAQRDRKCLQISGDGLFLTAIAQGVAGGIGMWLAGFPGLFWGTMMGFASFIPVVGTALIWIPATLYLFLTGDTTWAIFLAIWSVAVVGSIDNLLRPFLMQGSAGMNTLMIFFSLLGGIQLFGLIGLIYGPLIFAITMVLFNIYEEEFRSFLDQQDRS